MAGMKPDIDKRLACQCEKDGMHLYLKRVMDFLAKHSWIYNFKNTDIFVKEVLGNIPYEWKESLLNLNWDDLSQIPFGLIKDEWPKSLKLFLEEALKCHIYNASLSTRCVSAREIVIPSFIKRKMTKKKQAEVKKMSILVSDICQELQCGTVLDVGSGLGYLDQVLHHNFGLTVIGLDSIAARTHGAELRIQEGICQKNIYHSTYMVNNSSECALHLKSLLKQILLNREPCPCGSSRMEAWKSINESDGIIIVGLHSCGSLVHDMMKMFIELKEVKAFVCVGCCYHRMKTEEFPVSQTGKAALSTTKQSYPLWSPCIYGFRLGSQDSRAHWASHSTDDHILHCKNMAFRGVLQCFLDKENMIWKRSKRRFSKLTAASSFEDYCSSALKDINLYDIEREEKIRDLLELYHNKEHLFPDIRIMILLQVLLQPLWEGLIVVDRVAFLAENNCDSKVIIMCNELITPRNLAIYGVR